MNISLHHVIYSFRYYQRFHVNAVGLVKYYPRIRGSACTTNISWGGKGGRCIGLKILPPSCTDCFEIWESQPLVTMCKICLDFPQKMLNCWLEVSIRKVLRPATSTQVFLGFPVSTSECCDGSQFSKLLLHASHVALPT